MKLPFFATILTVLGILVLCALGTWQLQRLEWKQDLLAALERELQVQANQVEIDVAALPADLIFKRGYVEGRFLQDQLIYVGPRALDGKHGYHVVTPLETRDKKTILVNRGWIPLGLKAHIEEFGEEKVRVSGMMRPPPKGNFMTPDNIPKQDIWYTIDVVQFQNTKNLTLDTPYILYAELEVVKNTDYPKYVAAEVQLNNNHMQYAFFWFAMALGLLSVYVLRFMYSNAE